MYSFSIVVVVEYKFHFIFFTLSFLKKKTRKTRKNLKNQNSYPVKIVIHLFDFDQVFFFEYYLSSSSPTPRNAIFNHHHHHHGSINQNTSIQFSFVCSVYFGYRFFFVSFCSHNNSNLIIMMTTKMKIFSFIAVITL